MAGSTRFEFNSSSPETSIVGNYSSGLRGNYAGPSLDRCGSFREGGESRIFGSGISASWISGMGDLLPLSQCLMLEPIIMGDPKYTQSGELRRVLGISNGNGTEDNSFAAAHPKPSFPVAMDVIKRYRANVVDGCLKARGRAKKLDEQLNKLNKYCEAVNSKKQQRNEGLTNERSSGLNLKMSGQIHRNPSDIATPRLEDRAKNVLLNKRVRTSIAETRPECRSNGLQRQSPVMAKDRDMVKDSVAGSDLVEEKIRRLPAGEGWDKKMKRKRSIGTVSTRPIVSDGEMKRAVHPKLSNDLGLQSCDTPGFRSGSSNGTGGINKLNNTSTFGSNARSTPKNEVEKVNLPRDFTSGSIKERSLAKGNMKLNIREDGIVAGSVPVTKGKGSRAPRTGSLTATNSSPSITRVSGAVENWEQLPGANKVQSVGGANNRKRPMASGSSSPPMAKWVGQRPHKISRTKRSNLVSPVSNPDESQISSEGCLPSDFGSRISSDGTSSSPFSRGIVTCSQQFKMKLENVSSPARVSESEESGAGENKFKDKGSVSEVEEKVVNAGQNIESSTMLTKKRLLIKEETGDAVRRQGRTGRGSAFSRASISPLTEKPDNAGTLKPIRSSRPASDKNGSKSGRPLKKLSERKGFSRLGHTPNCTSPDVTGESEDDREELLEAAKFACNASYLACRSLFWKKMEPIYASVRLEDTSYLVQQLKYAEELHESLSQMFSLGSNITVDPVHGEISIFDCLVGGEKDKALQKYLNIKESAGMVDQFQDFGASCRRLNSERCLNEITPLYQRVLSALIVEDEIEEFEEINVERTALLQYATDDSSSYTESGKGDTISFECDIIFGAKTPTEFTSNKYFPCNGTLTSNQSLSCRNSKYGDEMLRSKGEYVHSEVAVLDGILRYDFDGPKIVEENGFVGFSSDCQYQQMCLDQKLLLELHSIDLYPETVPDLDDREDEAIDQEIVQLKKGLHQQVGKRKACLNKIYKATQSEREAERRHLEVVAMDKLVELAYKKLLATRGVIASRSGVAKVSKQVALAFVKRTLARCKKFEDSGTSCFSEPPLCDVILAPPPPRGIEAEASAFVGPPSVTKDKHQESHKPQPDPRVSGFLSNSPNWPDFGNKINNNGSMGASFETCYNQSDQAFAKNGPILNRGKKKEVLLDDVGGGCAAVRAPLTIGGGGSLLLGGTKGKRSERDTVSTRNAVSKANRASVGNNIKGDRKSKTKTKQKNAQLLPTTSGNVFVGKFTETTHPVYPSVRGSGDLVTNNNNSNNSRIPEIKESPMDLRNNAQVQELDNIEELDVGPDLGGPQDLTTWFNFDDVDGLQDHDSMGLEIPMDDLSELNMF